MIIFDDDIVISGGNRTTIIPVYQGEHEKQNYI